MSSGGGTTTSNTIAEPWSGVQPYLKDAYKQLSSYGTNIPSYYPGQTYAGFDPNQQQAMQGMLGYAGGDQLGQSIGNQFGALNYGLNSVYDPQSNPVLNQYVDSATRPLTQAYQQAVGRDITGNAVGAGGLGGSRQGVAEGLATRSYLDAVGDTSTGIYNNAYNQGLDQQARMMALAPQTMQAGMMPFDIMGQVGAQYQGMDQNAINEAMARHDYGENAGYNRYKDYIAALNGNPYGSTSTTGPNPNQSNMGSNLLGGAMMGATLGPVLGTSAGMGASLGALAPFLFMSDRRMKTDIKQVGMMYDGTPVYTFRYKAGGPIQMGVMAQDIEESMPDAVVEIDGIKYVNYGEINHGV